MIWEDYARWRGDFQQVMDPRMYTIEWLDAQVWSGRAKFFGTDDAAILVELRHYPTGAFDVHGLVAAGELQSIVQALIPAAERWGQSVGAIGSVIESRDGWARTLRDKGYRPYQTAVRKDW